MTSKELLYIRTIGEEKSLSKATQRLGIAQSTLSHCLSTVEGELGVPLFFRTGKGLVPTQAGEQYIECANEILKTYDMFLAKLKDVNSAPYGKLTVGMSRMISAGLLPKVLKSFFEEYPNVKFNLLDSNSENSVSELLAHRLDFVQAVHYADFFDAYPNLQCNTILEDPCMVAVKKDCKIPKKWIKETERGREIDLAAIRDMPIIKVTKPKMVGKIIDDLLAKNEISPRIAMTSTDYDTARQLAYLGMGVTLFPQSSIGFLAGSAGDNYFIQNSEGLGWRMSIIHHKDNPPSSIGEYFISIFREVLEQHLKSNLL